jgi:hypothetical protein
LLAFAVDTDDIGGTLYIDITWTVAGTLPFVALFATVACNAVAGGGCAFVDDADATLFAGLLKLGVTRGLDTYAISACLVTGAPFGGAWVDGALTIYAGRLWIAAYNT